MDTTDEWKLIPGTYAWGDQGPIIEDWYRNAMFDDPGFYRSFSVPSRWGYNSDDIRYEKYCGRFFRSLPFSTSWIIFCLCGFSVDDSFPASIKIMKQYGGRGKDPYEGTNYTVVRMVTMVDSPGRFMIQIEICFRSPDKMEVPFSTSGFWYVRWNRIGWSHNYYVFDFDLTETLLKCLLKIRNRIERDPEMNKKYAHISGFENLDDVYSVDNSLDKDLKTVSGTQNDPPLYLLWAVFNEKWKYEENACDDSELPDLKAKFRDDDGNQISVNYLSGSHLDVTRGGVNVTSYFWSMRSAISDHIELDS